MRAEIEIGALARQEVQVECRDCAHVWPAFTLPLPIEDACRVMAALHCPKCAANARRIVIWSETRPVQPAMVDDDAAMIGCKVNPEYDDDA